MSDQGWKPDILGAGYSRLVLDLGTDPDGEGAIEAVLVRRDQVPGEAENDKGVVLYVHGFTDYFFQTDLADFFARRGLRFYALDLRKCGRARKAGQTAHYVSDLALYDDEMGRALAIIAEAHPGAPVILAAHSTGGLIVPLWLHRTKETARGVVGVVLNSPWLDLQGSKTLRGPVTQLLRVLGKVRPLAVIRLRPGVYGQTLHVSGTGEWDFDLDLKPLVGFPITFGWLNAIRRAQARLHRGIETGVPTLVLRSTRSLFTATYSEACDRADLVLDTTQIAQWASSLGRQVTDAPITDARHDVFLSIPQARASAYAALDDWLRQASLA
ncbi:MAG TPA: alpha/beta hydrolase [Trebonia sp.]|nr:alpha/beta hydrolase [Trebonia sp.]